MSDVIIEKRLHISGLTPAISAADLKRRLDTYGTVTALDGIGALDALGDLRPYAYATLRAPRAKTAKCMSALSGATWKGAKLRVGEARPDFRERSTLENIEGDSPRSRKRRRVALSMHADDMRPVTPERAQANPAWRVTALGRIIRPLRMRPARPLDAPLDIQVKQSSGKETKKKSGRVRKPSVRARRKLIDPLRWGSTQIRGVFLEGGVTEAELETKRMQLEASSHSNDSSDDDELVIDHASVRTTPIPAVHPVHVHSAAKPPSHISTGDRSLVPPASTADASVDLLAEKSSTLALLSSLFGLDDSEADWGGAEELSDIDMGAPVSTREIGASARDDFEIVPRARTQLVGPAERTTRGTEGAIEEDTVQSSATLAPAQTPLPTHPTQVTKLKDLFAPREDEEFSLLGHLNLDLDLDLELDDTFTVPAVLMPELEATTSQHHVRAEPTSISKSSAGNTSPFFFPSSASCGRVSSILHALSAIAPARAFSSKDDESKRRARWEAAKGELTREWKRRYREAVKMRRRRGGEGA